MIRIYETEAEAQAAVQRIESALGIPYEHPNGFKVAAYDIPQPHPDGGWFIHEPSQSIGVDLGGVLAPMVAENLHDEY
jgi:hypothetical protein